MKLNDFRKISEFIWEIPKNFRSDMRVPCRVYASEKILEQAFRDESLNQLVNLAVLPGIQKYALAMPDIHEGYGAPVGGIFATDIKTGVISPGAIGYDQNCGVRVLKSDKTFKEIKPYIEKLADEINRGVPSGVGRAGRLKFKNGDLNRVLEQGARKMVELDYGEADDLEFSESGGSITTADASLVSDRARERGRDQLGTLGAGNHFIEIERVDEIFDEDSALVLGLHLDQILIQIHTGSRGLGHQNATDYIRVMLNNLSRYGIALPDRELAALPFNSLEGQNFFSALNCGANFAWANRQLITWEVRSAWKKVFGDNNLKVVYDVSHNIAKIEKHDINGGFKEVLVHRKGATRAFPPGHPEIPLRYQPIGQPVLIPGSMGTASYVLTGQNAAMEETFGSTCHGAGRVMSRHSALKQIRGEQLKKNLESQGIIIRGGSLRGLAEEAPFAYKDVDSVVEVVAQVGIAKKAARLKPIAAIKG